MVELEKVKKIFILIIAAVVILTAGFFAWKRLGTTERVTQSDESAVPYLVMDGNKYNVEIADTEEKHSKGLSGRESLPAETVLLFDFSRSDYWGIWMKDMNFPIDIIWLDKQYKVLDVIMNASPNSFPKVYKPHAPAAFVIETNTGFAVENNVQPGDIMKPTYQ